MASKYDTVISHYNNERYEDMKRAAKNSIRNYDILPFAKYMLDSGYDLFDFYDLMTRLDHLDINGYFYKGLHSYTM